MAPTGWTLVGFWAGLIAWMLTFVGVGIVGTVVGLPLFGVPVVPRTTWDKTEGITIIAVSAALGLVLGLLVFLAVARLFCSYEWTLASVDAPQLGPSTAF